MDFRSVFLIWEGKVHHLVFEVRGDALLECVVQIFQRITNRIGNTGVDEHEIFCAERIEKAGIVQEELFRHHERCVHVELRLGGVHDPTTLVDPFGLGTNLLDLVIKRKVASLQIVQRLVDDLGVIARAVLPDEIIEVFFAEDDHRILHGQQTGEAILVMTEVTFEAGF
jgi:hypothetical protein